MSRAYRAEVVAEFKKLFNVVQTSAVNRVVTTNADGVPAASLCLGVFCG